MSKPKIAIVSLTCCEGCEFAILDLGKRFLELTKDLEVKNFRLIEEDAHNADEKYDVVFVEGSPITKANLTKLKSLRERSKILIGLGNCAIMGGIHQIKNWGNKTKIAKTVYKNLQGLDNPEIKRLDEVVKVDFMIPGCPINAEDFLEVVNNLLAGKLLRHPERPVCFECQANGYECLLQKGEECLGPATRGGCNAVCLKSKQACWGCRGLLNQTAGQTEGLKNFTVFLDKRDGGRAEHAKEFFGIKKEIKSAYENKN
jgi:coenzyme F420-reducing hydrogenase gamma subunit